MNNYSDILMFGYQWIKARSKKYMCVCVCVCSLLVFKKYCKIVLLIDI